MRFTSYVRDGAPRLAFVDGADLLDLNDALPQVPADIRAALRTGVDLHAAGLAALKGNARRQPLSTVRLAPVVPDPGKTVCLGLNYFDHGRQRHRRGRARSPCRAHAWR